MRRFDVKIDTSKLEDAQPVELQEVNWTDELSVLSGVCEPEIVLVKDGLCNISVNGRDFVSAVCNTVTVKRMGYITIDDNRLYIEDGNVQYNDSAFTATYIKNDVGNKFSEAYVMIGLDRYDISDCQQDQWKNVQKVYIENSSPVRFDVVDCNQVGLQDTVLINDKPHLIMYDDEDHAYVVFDDKIYYGEEVLLDQYESALEFSYDEIGLTGEYRIYQIEVPSKTGELLKVFYSGDDSEINEGDIVRIQNTLGGDRRYPVLYNAQDQPYILYGGIAHKVSADVEVNAVLDGKEYPVVFDQQLTPDMYVGHLKDYDNVYISAFTSNGCISELYKRTLVVDGNDKYFSNEVVDFVSYSGVVINEVVRKVETDGDDKYINFFEQYNGVFNIQSIIKDSQVMYLKPYSVSDRDENIEFNLDELAYVAENYRNLTFIDCRSIFGVRITDEYIDNEVLRERGVYLKPFVSSISFVLPLGNAMATNLDMEQRQEDLLDERLWHYVNGNADIERDVYSPVYYKYKKNPEGEIELDKDGIAIIENTLLLNKLKFNLHFRTRNQEDWSVNEDNVELQNDGISSWNCLDHYFNQKDDSTGEIIFKNDDRQKYADGIANSADLLYFLNFTNNDVFYQKSALAKTFIRLSFFDSPVPNEQSLLWTSTVFFDEGACYSKYLANIDNDRYRDFDMLTQSNQHTVSVKGEPVNELGYLTFDDSKRLCMEFPIENRLNARVSSEGYYIYIYKEYAQYLHERTIYMRVDFNHAKIGQSVPMMMLHHRDENNEETKYQANCSNDVFQARDGVKMENMLNYIYIPIKIVYNEDLGRYTYHFENIVPAEEESDVLNINLFEVKYMDESK